MDTPFEKSLSLSCKSLQVPCKCPQVPWESSHQHLCMVWVAPQGASLFIVGASKILKCLNFIFLLVLYVLLNMHTHTLSLSLTHTQKNSCIYLVHNLVWKTVIFLRWVVCYLLFLELEIDTSCSLYPWFLYWFCSGGGDNALGMFKDNSIISNSWCYSPWNLTW